MISTIVGQSLRMRNRTNLVWAVSLLVWSVIIVAIFPTIEKIDYSQLLENYPQEVLEALGIQDTAAFSTPIGYINAELFSLVFPWAIVFLPLGVVNHSLPAAEERHFLDNLLSAPVARWQVVAAASVAAALSLAGVLFLLWAGTTISAELMGVDLGWIDMAQSCTALFPLASLIAAVGVFVAGARGGRGATLGVAGGVLVVMYMIPIISSLVDSLADLQWLSIFHYYNNWLNSGIDWLEFTAILALAAALTAAGAWFFERRDLAS